MGMRNVVVQYTDGHKRTLRTRWSEEAQKSMQELHGIDVRKSVLEAVLDAIKTELVAEKVGVEDIAAITFSTEGYFDTAPEEL